MQAATDLQYGRKDLERSAESNNLMSVFRSGDSFVFPLSRGQLAFIFFCLKGREGIVVCNDSHFRSYYIEYNQGQNK